MSNAPAKTCIICGDDDSGGDLLIEAPCGRHWVCIDDVPSFFVQATTNESLFPPKCCGQIFMLQEYEDYIPFKTAWAYQVKEQGEYAILAKFRVYCANPPCANFLHPTSHVEDLDTKITYAICENEDCGKLTCVSCKTLLDQGTEDHTCQQNEDEAKFKLTATEKGYQECFVCGATVELAEACNHITCECGNAFCYICGKDWPGLHGCPHYGPATYDEEGYNQEGFHRDTGLNREGLTRRQEIARARGEGELDEDDDEEEDDDDDDDDPEWEVLQHLTPDQRAMINQLPHGPREDALDQLRIELFETQGISFNQGHPQPNAAQDSDEDEGTPSEQGEGDNGEDADALSDSDSESENEDNLDPLDDGDHHIDEDALQDERYADDQSDDELDPMPELEGVGNASSNPFDNDANSNVTQHASDVESEAPFNSFPQLTSARPVENQSDYLDFNFNASYVGPDVHERLAGDFIDDDEFDNGKTVRPDYLELQGIDPSAYGRGRPASSSQVGGVRPATLMDLDEDEPMEKAQQVVEVERPVRQPQPPGA